MTLLPTGWNGRIVDYKIQQGWLHLLVNHGDRDVVNVRLDAVESWSHQPAEGRMTIQTANRTFTFGHPDGGVSETINNLAFELPAALIVVHEVLTAD